MLRIHGFALAFVVLVLVSGASRVRAQDANRPVVGGGISVPGWMGRIDPKEMSAGAKLGDAKLGKDGDALHVTTGPAVAYWNPENTARGNYAVKATFKEARYMNLNTHPHPYGIFIAGNDMGTDQQSYLYCAAYGNGTFIVRGFGPAPFQMNGRSTASTAVNRAGGPGGGAGRAGDAGNRRVREGQQGAVRDQRHRGGHVRQVGSRRPREAEVNRRRLRHSLCAQHGSGRDRSLDDHAVTRPGRVIWRASSVALIPSACSSSARYSPGWITGRPMVVSPPPLN